MLLIKLTPNQLTVDEYNNIVKDIKNGDVVMVRKLLKDGKISVYSF